MLLLFLLPEGIDHRSPSIASYLSFSNPFDLSSKPLQKRPLHLLKVGCRRSSS